ncbi:MAG: FAD-binding protein [Coriobacteriia bacterium]
MSQEEKTASGMDRRDFLKGALAVGAVTAAGTLVGCNNSGGSTSGGDTSGEATGPAFMTAPDAIPDSDIEETIDADIVIVGTALSGLCACRAAVEAGATNIVMIEKADKFQYRSNQFGTIGGQVLDKLGIKLDKNAVVGQIMKECGYRPNQRIWNLWADHSGEAFDWFLKPMEGKYVIENEADFYDGESLSVRKLHWPHPANAHPEKDYYPIFDDCSITLPDMGPYLQATVDICTDAGVKFMYSTWARQLVRPDNTGRVTGVIVQDKEGTYRKVNAAKAVLLATGDYASNKDMMEYYCPWATRFMSIFPNTDANGDKTNTGDGQRMGMWIGAKMEDGPHAPMTHHLGGPLGVDAFLLVDVFGQRFMNEDVGGQPLQNQISRLPQKTAWQVFDAKWPEQLGNMDTGHGNVNWFVTNDKVPDGSYGRNAYVSQEMFDEQMFGERGAGVKGNTIEELATAMKVDPASLKATIDRVNELAAAGNDEDFGKRADRFFPVSTAPFYAYKLVDTVLLVTMGGLQTDTDFNVLDTQDSPIEGLYAVGNCMGGRFLVDYPLPAPGVSHGSAMTHGMLVGKILATL